jgi:hypothetical protein
VGDPFRDREFDDFAPLRPADRKTGVPRPDWLTATGEHEELDLRPADPGAVHAGHDEATDTGQGPERRRPSREGARPGSETWENAVERAEHADTISGEEPVIRIHSSSARGSKAPGAGFLQAAREQLSKYPPVMIVAVVAIAIIAALVMRPHNGEVTTSIAAIHKYPDRFDGRLVKVRGRVGDVFSVGGGYAFELCQGRESIVVFTRSRVPVRREEVTITGSISNGILDGKTREALFETTP